MTPKTLANRLATLRDRLDTARSFFTPERCSAYVAVVRSLTAAYLNGEPAPQGISDEQWRQAVVRFSQGINYQVTANELLITFEGTPLIDAQGREQGDAIDLITFADIEAWIDAGFQGEVLGKDVVPGDEDPNVPHVIYTAVHGKLRKDGSRSAPNPQYEGLRQAIRQWMNQSPYRFADHLPGLRGVWANALRHRYREDMKRHVHREAQRALK